MASTNSESSNHFTDFSVRFATNTYLFGTCASWTLSSFMIVQAFTYFRHYKNDAKLLKSIVYIVILLQLMQTVTESYVGYTTNSAGWGVPDILSSTLPVTAINIQPIFETLTAFIVQYFFIWRIWTLSIASALHPKIGTFTRNACGYIALVGSMSLGTGIVSGVMGTATKAPPHMNRVVLVLWFALPATADTIITISMAALTLHARASLYTERETHDLLSRLSRIVLQTNLLTSILAIVLLPLSLRGLHGIHALPLIIFSFQKVLGKSYVVSLLANLNARKRSNALVVHSSVVNQATPATKLSTNLFSSAKRQTDEEGLNGDSMAASLPVHHSVVQMDSLNGSIGYADIAESVSKEGKV